MTIEELIRQHRANRLWLTPRAARHCLKQNSSSDEEYRMKLRYYGLES